MSRTVTGTIYDADGTQLVGGTITFQLLDVFETASEVYVPSTVTETTDSIGQFTTALGVPDTGTARYIITLPTGHQYEINLAAGASVDLVTLLTTATTAVDPDDLQTLLDAAELFDDTTVTSWPYTLLDTDRYIRASGTGNLTLLAAAQRKVPRIVFNYGTGVITVLPAGSDTINGAASKAIYPGEAWVFIDDSAGLWDAW